jgi:hypothetical protein
MQMSGAEAGTVVVGGRAGKFTINLSGTALAATRDWDNAKVVGQVCNTKHPLNISKFRTPYR